MDQAGDVVAAEAACPTPTVWRVRVRARVGPRRCVVVQGPCGGAGPGTADIMSTRGGPVADDDAGVGEVQPDV
nr:hypothetical protein GCM10020241_57040 [Streptoalloteichus tenebrarius]